MSTVKMTAPTLDERTEQHYMGFRTQVPVSQLSKAIPDGLREVFGWLGQQGISPAGAPFIRYHVINMDPQLKMDIELGVPIEKAAQGNDRVKAGVLPAGRYASLVYTGVTNGIAGNKALIEWAEQQGLKWDRWDDPNGDAFRSRYETFITDPDDEPDSAKWDTEVAIMVK
jgi:effector-binding domain-containing protein